MSASDLIDSTGSVPKLKIGALVTSILGTIAFGYQVAILRVIDGIGGGITSTLGAIEEWLAGGVISTSLPGGPIRESGIVDLLFGGLIRASNAAVAEHVAWLDGLGLVGQLVAFVEVLGIVYILVTVTTWILRQGARSI